MNKHIGRIGSLFDWAINRGYSDRNVAKGRTVKAKVVDRNERLPFTDEELQTLISSDDYGKNNGKMHDCAHRFWLPLLGMFTGARLNELSQLYISDFRKEKEIHYFSINADNEDKKLKNKASVRNIPIHPTLIELGLLNRVNELRRHGEKRLFPELKKTRDNYGALPSKWFGRFCTRCGIEDRRKTFHSFRHTVANNLKQNGASVEQRNALLGHSDVPLII
jgi:integrase